MHLVITSASGNILSADAFARITIMTEDGQITVLPGHEPLLSAIRPGILSVEYYVGGKIHTGEYATGGGVLNISHEVCTIVADVVVAEDTLTDLEYIESQKKEAEAMMNSYRAENGAAIDPKKLVEMEYELLKFSAMHRLGQKFHDNGATGSRK
jgi:F-type H+-transporting ATPase subunit epsilon